MIRKKREQPYVRGEKIRFGKRERKALHSLPSALAHEPLIVHSRPRHSFPHACARLFAFVSLIVVIVLALIFYIIESGSLDRMLGAQANAQIKAVMPSGYNTEISATRLRLSNHLKLQLMVDDVEVLGPEETVLARINEMAFAVDPIKLIGGQIAINAVSVSGIDLEPAALPSTGTFRLTDHRVDSLPVFVEQIFDRADFVRGMLMAAETQQIEIRDIEFPMGSATPGVPVDVNVRTFTFSMLSDGIMRADGQVALDGTVFGVSAEATTGNGRVKDLQAEVSNMKLTPFLLRTNSEGEPSLGVAGTADFALSLTRADPDTEPEIYAEVDLASGRFLADRVARPFRDAQLSLSYDNIKNSIELSDSSVNFDGSIFPFSGGIIDLDRINSEASEGYGLDFLVSGGKFRSREPGMPNLLFDAKFSGEYHGDTPRLLLDDIAVSSPQGTFAASLKVLFGDHSPEIDFVGHIERMDAEAVKQLWPFWIARKPREWVSNNIHGGEIANGEIAVLIPAGRIQGAGEPISLEDDELRIAFDVGETRLTINDQFPDVTDSSARVEIKGPVVSVAIGSGTIGLEKGRAVSLDSGTFTIANAYEKPVKGVVDVNLSGAASDLVKLAAGDPVNALKDSPYGPDDFSGTARANVKAEFLLADSGSSLPSEWSMTAQLDDVALGKPVSGYAISGLDGNLDATPGQLHFAGSADANGVPVNVDWRQPFGSGAAEDGTIAIRATLGNGERNTLVPGLDEYLDGTLSVAVDRTGDDASVSVDLTKAVLRLPPIGWQKPVGIPASLSFDVVEADGALELNNVALSGPGLSGKGTALINGQSLQSATLTNVSLSPGDDINVAFSSSGSGQDITITGKSFSIQPLMEKLKQGQDGPSSAGGAKRNAGRDNVDISFDVARLVGADNQTLSGVSGGLVMRGGVLATGSLAAMTSTGQPLKVTIAPDGGQTAIHLSSAGAGALLRFAGVYQKMVGGQLRADAIQTAQGWQGMLHLENFHIVRDEQLKTLLSAPTGQDGRSLNATYKNQINDSDQRFQRAQASVVYADGVLSVSDAFVRGDQVGATFKGIVRDAAGNIDLTGTFMPAYGLNRIFAEIPIIGPILGNGQDKGLFGITFRLAGKTDKPELVVNPLSAIAPGVFRRIFEFQ